MIRYSRAFLSGGHGDLFPNTKAAAHLTPQWVLSRTTPPAPGAGHCYASFTYPEKHSKFQGFQPEIHESKVVSMHATGSLPHCTTKRPSLKVCGAFVEGTKAALDGKNVKTNNTPMARANIEAKEQAERMVKTREFAPSQEPMAFREGYTPFADLLECCEFIDKRTNALRKIEDRNSNGYTKEWIPFELNPRPKPTPPPPKK
ncbi:unnamed protein product [Phytomonas sp. EM1]|nr:unnamed protein product [Phytomonas sp. EM1]|eukprot:CCW61225.1 unnamed protein product [Phytomonas sp. isolate EM1]